MLELFKKEYPRFPQPIMPSYTKLSSEDVTSNGVVTHVSKFVESSFADNYKQFTSADFSISNILSVGATQLLKPVNFANSDVASVAAGFDKLNEQLNSNSNETA